MNDQAPATNAPPPPGYTTTASIDEIVERLRGAQSIAILTHSKPDGDAVGSSLALARTLDRINVRATPVYIPPFLTRLKPLLGSTEVIFASDTCWAQPPLSEVDTVVVVDTGAWSQLGSARPWLESRRDQTIIIDHHSHGDPDMAEVRLVDPSAAAAASIIARIALRLLDLESCADLPADIAEPLYLGVATDTGWFRYSNTTAEALRLGADLIDAGADHRRLYRLVEQSDTPNRLRLIQRALASLELFDDDHIAVMTITRQDILDCDASHDELGGLTDLPQSVATIRAVAVVTELESGLTKVSLRSKSADDPADEIDVNTVAGVLGGGGHVHAAGARIAAPLAAARRRVIAALTDAASR